MKWAALAAVVALAAIVGTNVLLLLYGRDRHDPVGRLSPISNAVRPDDGAGTTLPVPHPQRPRHEDD